MLYEAAERAKLLHVLSVISLKATHFSGENDDVFFFLRSVIKFASY